METDSDSPLLTGKRTDTPLDLITYNLYFLFPLSDSQIQWLNKPIYSDKYFHINNWSLTHTLFGMFWGILRKWFPFFSLVNYLIFHTLFEIWEVIAIHKLGNLDFRETLDIIMDTIFGVIGFYIGTLFN